MWPSHAILTNWNCNEGDYVRFERLGRTWRITEMVPLGATTIQKAKPKATFFRQQRKVEVELVGQTRTIAWRDVAMVHHVSHAGLFFEVVLVLTNGEQVFIGEADRNYGEYARKVSSGLGVPTKDIRVER